MQPFSTTKFPDVFKGVEKGCIGNEQVKTTKRGFFLSRKENFARRNKKETAKDKDHIVQKKCTK